ncbi:MAG: hypothetical protein CML68_17490 [Rhodobacteraceae bacterium]|nr:hypothetical protein [Paracoccaceae bacterium]
MKIDPKIAKILAKSKASLQSFESEVKSMSATAAKQAASDEKAAKKVVAQIEAADKKIQKDAKEIFTEAKTGRDKLLKTYADLVRKTDGATSMRPSVAKALDKLLGSFDEKHLKVAADALKKHKAEVIKDKGSKDPEAQAFGQGIDKLLKAYF